MYTNIKVFATRRMVETSVNDVSCEGEDVDAGRAVTDEPYHPVDFDCGRVR